MLQVNLVACKIFGATAEFTTISTILPCLDYCSRRQAKVFVVSALRQWQAYDAGRRSLLFYWPITLQLLCVQASFGTSSESLIFKQEVESSLRTGKIYSPHHLHSRCQTCRSFFAFLPQRLLLQLPPSCSCCSCRHQCCGCDHGICRGANGGSGRQQ